METAQDTVTQVAERPTKRIHISLPEGELRFIAEVAGKEFFGVYSHYVRSLIRADMERREQQEEAVS